MFKRSGSPRTVRFSACHRASIIALTLFSLAQAASAQQPQTDQPQETTPAAVTTPDAAQAPATVPSANPVALPPAETQQTKPPTIAATPEAKVEIQPSAITEDDLKKLLVGKLLYLRDGYLDDNLTFNEHGILAGHSAKGSYTLSGVAIEKVHLTKHKVELEGQRYGLHFLGALPSEDPTTAMDRVQITPKKKILKITIDRELLITPKKSRQKGAPSKPVAPAPTAAIAATTDPAQLAQPTQPDAPTEAEQAQTEIAAAPTAERPADPQSITTTTSPAHAATLLKDAIDHIFSVGFDDRMMASMPDFWKLYYQAVAAKSDYRPADPTVLRQSAVDKKARLQSAFEPASNEFAQAHGVAGLALYHVVIGPDGKPGEIAVARPIGFGLDENAVASIRKASFEPALKAGKPVPVLLDLIVEFHIYSGLTGATAKAEPGPKMQPVERAEAAPPQAEAILPGPYSILHH